MLQPVIDRAQNNEEIHMKKLILGLTLVLGSYSAFATTCTVLETENNDQYSVEVNVAKATISLDGETYSDCEKVAYTKDLADQLLEGKLEMIAQYYGEDPEVLEPARAHYTKEIYRAVGGTIINCLVDPTYKFGIIVNGENSSTIANGGNSYNEMGPATCN
jgi:hypothetical protein